MLEQLMCSFLLVLGKYVDCDGSFSTISRQRLCSVVLYGILSLGATISPARTRGKEARDNGKNNVQDYRRLLVD